MDEKATSPRPLSQGEGNGEEPDVRVVSVNEADDSIHLLPLDQATAHELGAGCWCEPEQVEYTPGEPFPGERYEGWYHHEAN